jgi:hypothetical protein
MQGESHHWLLLLLHGQFRHQALSLLRPPRLPIQLMMLTLQISDGHAAIV